jgi:small-conductance mechanosensitive channel
MRIDIAGISIDSTLLVIILGIIAGAIITKLLLDTIIKNIFATYPDDTKESLRFIIDILVVYLCMTLILYALISNYIILLAMFMMLAGIILYLMKDFLKDFFMRLSLLSVKAFGIGDYIEVVSHRGRVLKIGSMYTLLRKDDNSLVCIPNMMISKSIIVNFTSADYIKLQETMVVNVPEQDVAKIYSSITQELDIFGYKRVKIVHKTSSEGIRFAVTINLEDAASISNDTANLHKALNIVKSEYVTN